MIRNRFCTAITMLMALLLFFACAREELSPLPSTQDQIVATMNEPATTRTAMGETEDGTNAVGILWTAEDKIGVFDASGSSQKCYMKTSDSGNKADATFAVTGTTAFSSPTYAYYPYSADNDGRSLSSLVGNLPFEQNMDSGKLYGDYKYGISEGSSAQGHKFVFSHLFSMARIEIDADNTPLSGEKLSSLTVTVNRGSEKVNIAGDFTFSAISGEWKQGDNLRNSVTLKWTDGPVLSAETTTCYASLFPTIAPGDVFTIEVVAGGYRAVFTATSRIRFSRENIYTFPVTLRKYESLKMYDPSGNEIDYESLLPVISSFGFNVSDNAGKILDNQLAWNSSSHAGQFNSVTSLTADIKDDEITLTIPYLYDFKLKPSFSLSNSNCVVTVNGVQQTSGTSEVDFSKPVIYTVTNTASKYSRDYKVTISNTGLPVVVIEHDRNAGDFSEVKKGGFLGIGAKVLNKFVNFYIRGKDTDWVETDKISVYDPDGTVDVDHALCGVRLRGNTTQEYPKKPFAVKLKTKASVLGMPSHKRWVLLANWLDHSMIRNAVAFDIAHAIDSAWMEHKTTATATEYIGDGIPWNVHGQHVELVVDGHHVGNYYLCEQIKIDENRLDIKEPYDAEDNPAAFADCGYLLEFDMKEDSDIKYTTSNGAWVKFKNDEPKGSDVYKAVSQKIQRIEDNLDNGKYAEAYTELDINSMVDQFLIWELTMNREYGDPGSIYMFMDGNGKLSAGPVWDFDRGTFQNQEKATSLGNSTSYRVKPDNAWMFQRSQESEAYSYVWYRQLAKDATFRNTVVERWAVIRPYLDMVVELIGEYGENQAVSYKYNSTMWPTNKADITKYKSDFKDWSGDEQLGANGNYQEVIDNFVTVYQERLAGMDELILTWKNE